MHTYSKPMVQRISGFLMKLTDGEIGVGQINNPGDGLHYVDARDPHAITGRNASRRAVAYYGTAAREYAERTGHNVPAWLDAVMDGLVPASGRGAVAEAARAGAERAARLAGKRVYVTHNDTWNMILDGGEFRHHWVDREESEDLKRAGSREVFDWSLTVYLDDGRTATVTHPDMIKAMRVMVAEREQRTTRDDIIDLIAAVLDAENDKAASDELCQLDGIIFDLITQVAAVGKVICP